MIKMVCKECGSENIEKSGDYYFCKGCGAIYSSEDLQQLLQEAGDSSYGENEKGGKTENDSEENTPFDVYWKETNGAEALDEYTNDSLLDMASEIIAGFINKIKDADNKRIHIKIDEDEFFKARKYLYVAVKRDNSIWREWYLLGILENVQQYDDIYDGFELHPFNYFSEAVKLADEDTIKNQILPFVDSLKKQYRARYEAGLIEEPDTNILVSKIMEYMFFFQDCKLAESYAHETQIECDELMERANKETQELIGQLEAFSKARDERIAKAVKEMNSYKEQYVSLCLEVEDNRHEYKTVKDKALGHLLGANAKERDAMNALDKRKEELNNEMDVVVDKAYQFLCQNVDNAPDEEVWKKNFRSIKGLASRISMQMLRTHPNQWEIDNIYNKIDRVLVGYGFSEHDYYGNMAEMIEMKKAVREQSRQEEIDRREKIIRIYGGLELSSNIVYTVRDYKIYRGKGYLSHDVIFTIVNDKIYRGNNITYKDNLAYTIRGNHIYKGSSSSRSDIEYTIEGNKVYLGANTYGEYIYRIGN